MSFGHILLVGDVFVNFLQTTFSCAFFILAIIFVIYSGYSGVRAYFFRMYKFGPNVTKLIEKFKEELPLNYKEFIGRRIYEANVWNSQITEKKVIYTQTE